MNEWMNNWMMNVNHENQPGDTTNRKISFSQINETKIQLRNELVTYHKKNTHEYYFFFTVFAI